MKSKYPTTTRVTAGKLSVGDRILVRERKSDAYHLPNSTYQDIKLLPPGIYEVTEIDSFLDHGPRRANRHYLVNLTGANGDFTIDVMFIHRLNLITEEA